MYRILDCITQQHNYWLVIVAALVCVAGISLTVRLTNRLPGAKGRRRLVQLWLSSMIAGATIWSTHFIAMLAYEPGFEHGYEPLVTGLSLLVAVLGVLAANAVLAFGTGRHAAWLAGGLFGLAVAVMHYTGMQAYLIPGELQWEPGYRLLSLAVGAGLGAWGYVFAARRGLGRRNWCLATALLVGAICGMHFTGMSAINVRLSPLADVPEEVISDAVMGMLIFGVMGLIQLVGFASASIESNVESEAHQQLAHAALHDPLTGMPNRMWLTQFLADLADRLDKDETERVAVLTIDLNLFKEVNDLHGHAVGDKVLQAVACRLIRQQGADEFITRVGGDEFVAVKQGFRRIEQVLAFAERLHASVIEPIDMEEISVRVGAAIGVATSLTEGRDPLELLHKSDLAMYRAKSDPTGAICQFSEDMDRQSREKLQLVHDLRQACAAGQFELVYQLQNDITSLEPVGFEVLLRWNHPTRGRVGPGEFIPAAEETGLIREIGHWVLREACTEAASWARPFQVAVNVAPQQLVQPSFVEDVMDILLETGLSPERLELEITESSIIDDQAHTLKVMHRLKDYGVRIAMDDFGTGYSSLATLQTFPFDKIKIDQSFVRGVHRNAQSAAIVRSTLLLGSALNIPVLAEGVEEQDELNFLQAEKCASVQGFYFGTPMSQEDMRRIACGDGAEGRKQSA
ncbi:EAL domain-containing protein [Leisingera daeponensis]|uniref:EAL domain-containing protein n=1 Tax=Leisingera daeponensis TaxID=405746 RepID=A0ABS7NKH9_9RHOB|nr:EAL domain-containing protein [Leisingera daeponensis]MBY6056632.1 EAL domain-containing protein [Leisingera daeponensis]MBY6141689.1 EAL domain-containing protein [Leisingera daeponensis]